MVGTSRLSAIEAIDVANRRIVAQAGVVNQWVTNAVRAHGLCYAPDPSSQPACTIGGNIAENSGGPHTLKYGVTTNHVLGVEPVLASGEVVALGGAAEDRPGYDLVALVSGAEGPFGIVTRATLRPVPPPEAFATRLAARAGGRLAPRYCPQDGVVPRTRVPDILRHIAAAAKRHRLRIANVFHAGDGNLHPILLFDERDQDEVRRVLAAGREILEACV